MNTKIIYKPGDKVKTSMGVGVVESVYAAGVNVREPNAAIVNHGRRNPSCPTWFAHIEGKVAAGTAVYSL